MNDEDHNVEVRLLGVPVALHMRAATHLRSLQREFELIRRDEPDARSVPNRLAALVSQLNTDFDGVGAGQESNIENAVERGDATIDLLYRLPTSAGPAALRLGALLDEADAFCRARGMLLTLVTPSDEVAYRRWFLGEFARQADGATGTPWSSNRSVSEPDAMQLAVNRGEAAIPGGWQIHHDGDAVVVVVTGPVDLVSAPALRNLLVATPLTLRTRIVDLTACDFIDSVGVSVLVAATMRAESDGAELQIRVGSAVREVLHIAGLLDRLAVVP